MIRWRTLHKWLGLLIAVQVFLWTGSGIVISYLDGAETSGQVTRRAPASPEPLALDAARLQEPASLTAELVAAGITGISDLSLQRLHGTAVYRVSSAQGVSLFDASSGESLSIDAKLAASLAERSYAGSGRLVDVSHLVAGTHDLVRHAGDLWRVSYDDDLATRVYLAADDGRLLAHLNDSYDLLHLMLTLHFMDYSGGHNFNNWLIRVVAMLTLAMVISGIYLLSRVVPKKSR